MKKIFLLLITNLLLFLPVKSDTNINSIYEGNKDAKIEIIVFESLTCSHCASFHKEIYPILKKNFVDNDFVKIVFKSFPLDLAALNASKIAHCNNDGNPKILHLLYEKQNDWVKGENIKDYNSNLRKIIKDENIELDFDKCLNNNLLEDHILEQRIEGVKKYKVNATPTIIINEQKFDKPLTYNNLEKIIEKKIKVLY
jgi:protein-disulfide isomerase